MVGHSIHEQALRLIKPKEGECPYQAGSYLLNPLMEKQRSTRDPSRWTIELQYIEQFVMTGPSEQRMRMEILVLDLGWRPLEGTHEVDVDYFFSPHGKAIPMEYSRSRKYISVRYCNIL